MDFEYNSIFLADDGSGNKIKIPVLMISKRDGTKIIDYMATNTNHSTVMSIQFPVYKTDKVYYF